MEDDEEDEDAYVGPGAGSGWAIRPAPRTVRFYLTFIPPILGGLGGPILRGAPPHSLVFTVLPIF